MKKKVFHTLRSLLRPALALARSQCDDLPRKHPSVDRLVIFELIDIIVDLARSLCLAVISQCGAFRNTVHLES